MQGDKVTLRTNSSYDEWQSKLSKEFFHPNQAKLPIIMFLDDEELSRMFPDAPDATESLRFAVMSELRQTDKIGVLDGIRRRIESWTTSPQEDPPPCLPLLALTVVAGSRMRNDGEFSSTAYYPRLADLMSSEPNDLRVGGLRKHFDEVAAMWQQLHSWIAKHQDRLGPSTIYTHRFFNLIGYPLSQTVLKTSDRERLADFFERIHLDRRCAPSSEELLRLLRYWLDRPRGLSKAFLRLVEQDSSNPLLTAVLLKLASEERSTISTARNRIRLSLRLCIDLEEWSVGWVIPLHKDLEADELRPDDGPVFSIARPTYGSTYELRGGALAQVAGLIDRPFRAVGSRAVLTKDVQDAWILRIEPKSGKWQSVDSMEPGLEHLLMVRASESPTTTELLDTSAEPGYRRLRNQLILGWDLFADVFVSDQTEPKFTSGDSFAYVFKADVGPSPRLVNGLPLRTSVGGRHYLQGGEPDLLIPPGGSERYVHVELDGVQQEPPLKANGAALPLRYLGPMSEGKHEVRVDGLTLNFFVQKTGTDAFLEAGLDSPLQDLSDPLYDDSGPTYIACRRGKDAAIWLITSWGRVRQHREPPLPSGLPASFNWKVSVPNDATWAITERNGQLSRPQCIRDERGEFGPLDQISENFWRRITPVTITSSDNQWREYLAQFIGMGIHGR